jgi:hypothetical protein
MPLRTTGTPLYAAKTARTERAGGIVRKKTILQKYINEAISTKEVEEEHGEDLATQKDEQLGGYEEMMFNNGDDRMASGFGTMDFEFENGMEFFVEVAIKEEMDFMEMINNNP